MPAEYRPMTFTGLGRNLLMRCQTEGASMEFTHAVLGKGEHDPYEDLSLMTDLVSPMQTFNFSSINKVDNLHVELRWIATNADTGEGALETAYQVSEVGIYAKELAEGSEPILYAVTSAVMPHADWMLAYDGQMPSEITMSAHIGVASADAALVAASLVAPTMQDVQDVRETVDDLEAQLEAARARISVLEEAGGVTCATYTLDRALWELQSDGSFMQDIEAPEATALHMPVVSFDGADLDVAVSNKLESVEALDGIIRFRSKLQPVVDMNPNIFLLLGNEVTP